VNLYGFVKNRAVDATDTLGLDLKINGQIGRYDFRNFVGYHEDKLTKISIFSIHGFDDKGNRSLETSNTPSDQGWIDRGIDLDGDGVIDSPGITGAGGEFDKAPAGVSGGQTATNRIRGHSVIQLHIGGKEDGCNFYMVYDIQVKTGKTKEGTLYVEAAKAVKLPEFSKKEKDFPKTEFSQLIHLIPRRAMDLDTVVPFTE
jgi:hypothetical protein